MLIVILLLALTALAVWGVVAAVSMVSSDGYGLPESADRLRQGGRPGRLA